MNGPIRTTILGPLSTGAVCRPRYVEVLKALHKKSGVDSRCGGLALNKTPYSVAACNLCAKPVLNKIRCLARCVGR